MERYRAMIAKDPNSRVFAALAELYRKAGMLDEAVRLCWSGTKAHPKYMSGRVALARAYADKGMIKEAKEEVLTVVSITPDNILANKILGEIHLLEGDTVQRPLRALSRYSRLPPMTRRPKRSSLKSATTPINRFRQRRRRKKYLRARSSRRWPSTRPPRLSKTPCPPDRAERPPESHGGIPPSGEDPRPAEPNGFGRQETSTYRLRTMALWTICLTDETGGDVPESERMRGIEREYRRRSRKGEGDLWEVEQEQEQSRPRRRRLRPG